MKTFLVVVGGLALIFAGVALVSGHIMLAGLSAGVCAICTIITLPGKK